MKKISLILAAIAFLGTQVVAQNYTLNSKNSKLEVLGTSTLHDWEEVAEFMSGKASIKTDNDQLAIQSLHFIVPVEKLKSEHNAMDNNTYEALKSEDYPEIKYELKEVESIEKNGQTYKLSTTGNLTIAGVTKVMKMTVESIVSTNEVSFSGKVTFKMTDFKVDPPTALLGTVKTGDEVTIQFNVKFNQ